VLKIKFYGAAGEIGRSCILVESNDTKILLDCGVKLGAKEEYPVIDDSEFRTIDAIVITHSHLDHIAYLPHIFSIGWNGTVYATKPTFELTNVLLSDYMRISKPENVTREGASRVNKHFKLIEYNQKFKIKGLELELIPAGHILGSAMIEISDQKHRLLYTADFNLKTTRLLNGAHTDHLNADTLIIESTYGGDKDVHPAEQKILNSMLASIKETINQGGKVIIPCFAVGRAQEVLVILDNYMKSGLLPKIPIYIDGMIGKVMRIYRHNVIYCRQELQQRILMSEDDPFKSENFYNVKAGSMRNKVIYSPESSIIVTTSGMISGGPIMKYLTKLAGDEKNKLVLVGYQAEGTIGRQLADGAKEVTINGSRVRVKMAVVEYRLSAHADRLQLMRLISKVNNLKNIFIIHGEVEKSRELYNALSKKYKTYLPKLKEEFVI
jgi:hypothetical protein